jgi:plastocyanin
VHSALPHSLAVLAAEKSKVPFFIAGGVLAAWALIISIGFGLRRAAFPANLIGQRALVAVTLVLVLAALSTAVITSGSPAKGGEERASAAPPSAGGTQPAAPAPTAPASTSTQPAPAGGAKPPAASTLKLSAAGAQLAYNTRQLSAHAGKVTIAFTNGSPLEHDVTIAQGSKVLGATPIFTGGTRTVTLTLAAGSYTFYCSVPGHRQAGMEGTLSVT